MTRITLNNRQLAHGPNLTAALEMLAHRIHPRTVTRLFNDEAEVVDQHGTWRVEHEPAFTGEMIRAACESDLSFVTVQQDMYGQVLEVV